MARWLVADSLYCEEARWCGHMDSYSHYLREAGEAVTTGDVIGADIHYKCNDGEAGFFDVLFLLDCYQAAAYSTLAHVPKKIAQVAAVCDLMPWDVRKADGSCAYDLVLSSIPWMVEAARSAGCRAEYQPLAFDTRARVCGMNVKRDLDCIFIGTTGPNHQKRTALLKELSDVVTVLPPVFGRDYFKTLARAKVVLNVHAEWARGAANNMRLYEAAGMGCEIVSDGSGGGEYGQDWEVGPAFWWHRPTDDIKDWRRAIKVALRDAEHEPYDTVIPIEEVLRRHTYESRIPQLIEWARSL